MLLLKHGSSTIILIIIFTLSLQAAEKTEKGNTGKDNNSSKQELIFDSCGKEKSEKCDKDIKFPATDYSKSLK